MNKPHEKTPNSSDEGSHNDQSKSSGSHKTSVTASSHHRMSKKTKGRVKIKMEFIENKSRRYTTFSKRKTGIMKKAFELSTLTGTQVMLLVASETGHVYTYATEKLQPMITSEVCKRLIQKCLSPSHDDEDTTETRLRIENFSNEEIFNDEYDDYEDEDEDEEDNFYEEQPQQQYQDEEANHHNDEISVNVNINEQINQTLSDSKKTSKEKETAKRKSSYETAKSEQSAGSIKKSSKKLNQLISEQQQYLQQQQQTSFLSNSNNPSNLSSMLKSITPELNSKPHIKSSKTASPQQEFHSAVNAKLPHNIQALTKEATAIPLFGEVNLRHFQNETSSSTAATAIVTSSVPVSLHIFNSYLDDGGAH